MRKAIYSLVVGVYFLLSCGVVVQLHYCMDRLAEIGLFSDQHLGACTDCGMAMDEANDCCQDRTEVIKLVQDQSVSHSLSLFVKFDSRHTAQLPVFTDADETFEFNRIGVQSARSDSEWGRHRYRRLSVFRI